jgi:predicted dehydrogenase
MTKKWKFAVVGTGAIFTAQHLKALQSHPEIEITALCDTNLQRAEKHAREIGVPHVYEDYAKMLKECPEIEVVDICTPNLYHSRIAVEALLAGKHVFCEKPDAINPEEAQKMADTAEKSDKLLMVMRNNRFTPTAKFLKQYIQQGNLGEIYTGRCGWIRRRGIPGKGGWFTNKELSGGGPLIDLGVHFIDLAIWLMGNPKPVSVSGATYSKFADNNVSSSTHSRFGDKQENGTYNVEDLATGFIRFENGASLQIEFSWAANIEEDCNFVELRGTKAGSIFKNNRGLQIFSEEANQLLNISPLIRQAEHSPHAENINHFIDCLQNRALPIFTPDQGVDMIKIIDAIYKSAESGREVRL